MAAPAAASPAPAPPPAPSQWERLEWAAHALIAGSALRCVSASGALRGEAGGGLGVGVVGRSLRSLSPGLEAIGVTCVQKGEGPALLHRRP